MLIDRSMSPLKMTSSGEVFYKAAKHFLELEHELTQEIKDIENNKSGILRIGTTPFRASCMLPKSIVVFKDKYPGVTVEIITGTLEKLNAMLLENEIEFLS